MVGTSLFILLLELTIYYLLGTLVAKSVMRMEQAKISLRVILGFFVYQILFQSVALPMIYTKKSLTLLTHIWVPILAIIVLITAVVYRKFIGKDLAEHFRYVWRHKVLFAGVVLLLGVMFYVTYTQGQLDEDSRYYIGLVTTTATTDTMYRVNVYTGQWGDALYLRRALVTGEINIAMLCKLFPGVHPIIMMRMYRAWLNVVLTANAIYLLGTQIWSKDKDVIRKSVGIMMVAYMMYFVFDNSICSNATFLLHRGYEGKAITANLLAYFVLYLGICFFREKRKCYWILLAITMWAGVALSSSAIFVCGGGIGIILLTVLIEQFLKRWSKNS